MPKKTTAKKAAAAALQITQDCERGQDGYGALPFVVFDTAPGTISRPGLSKLKAQLFAAGFESNEVSLVEHLPIWPSTDDRVYQDWHEESIVSAWDPRKHLDDGSSWTLVGVLYLSDLEGDSDRDDAVALFARPAGMADAVPESKPWPFPKTEGGGPNAASDASITEAGGPAPAPTMTRAEATDRKTARFELLDPTDATLRTFTPRVEKHGDDDVSAASLGLTIEAPNTILDLLSPTLRHTLYAAPSGQVTLPGVEESTPLLRTKVIEKLQLKNAYEGWTLCITAGVDSDITIGDCKVDKFVVTPQDGGTVQLDLRIGSSDIDAAEAGWLYGHLRQEIEITLHAPAVKPDAIDGTQAAFDADHPQGGEPDAGDLFAAEHGPHNDDEAETENAEA